MNPDKQIIVDELLTRGNGSPFLLVVNYTGMTVPEFNELRGRLREGGAECHVAKNSYMKRALESAGMSGLEEILQGQTAFITGEEDVCGAAKAVANFVKEFKKPEVKAGLLDGELLNEVQIKVLADLPSREVLLSTLLGVINEPASMLARVLNEPGASLARVVKAKFDEGD
jgi:large subunit ribosomal protein L10